MDGVHDAERLKELQSLPLSRKIQITQTRIIEWYQHYNGNVCVSFSGGKDSTVLLHIARKIYPNIKAVFSNTGLEFAEIQRFVKSWDNVDIIVPQMRFDEVISTYGYPLIGKEVANNIFYARRIGGSPYKRNRLLGKKQGNDIDTDKKSMFDYSKWLPLARDIPAIIGSRCCDKMKKQPMHHYQSEHGVKMIDATLAEESLLRKQMWIRRGCNAFDGSNPKSSPMSFWTEQDVLSYIAKNNIKIASVYGDIVSIGDDGNAYPALDLCGHPQCNLKCTGCQRTGCVYCGFGAHHDKSKGKETRFQLLAKIEPRKYEYAIGGGQWVDNPYYDPAAPEYDGDWKNWNPKKIWTPSKKGLGMGKVFDMVNEIYGKDFIKYD